MLTVMTEPVQNTVCSGPPKLEEEKDQTSLTEAFGNTLDISQYKQNIEASEGKDRAEQENRQQDGPKEDQTVPPPAAESSSPETTWAVGAPCRAMWSEDGQVYPAMVVAVDGGRCRVRFNGYGNQEDMDLSALKPPDADSQTQRQNFSQEDWKPGSRCRAVYSEDSLVYPAVVLWVKGQRCRIRFDNYNNEEEQDVSSLLHPDELHGPSRAATAAAKGSSWKTSATSSNLDWKRRRRREENQGERGGERRREENFSWVSLYQCREKFDSKGSHLLVGWQRCTYLMKTKVQLKDQSSHQSKVEKEAEEKKRGNQQRDEVKKPTNHSFSFFPPFPPPPQSSSGEPRSLVPPPPLWMLGGAADASSSALMLWYMCGFHTGIYMAQQGLKSHSKD